MSEQINHQEIVDQAKQLAIKIQSEIGGNDEKFDFIENDKSLMAWTLACREIAEKTGINPWDSLAILHEQAVLSQIEQKEDLK